MRDHQPVLIEDFGGFWARGDAEACPADHFPDCGNMQFTQSGVQTRDGLDIIPNGPTTALRMYEYNSGQQTLLILDANGTIFHVIPNVSSTPILTIVGMTDFGFLEFNGRAYISPSLNIQTAGMTGQSVYVYKGDGTAARKAAGTGPVGGTFTSANSAAAGNVAAGFHVFGVVYQTDTGFNTSIGTVLSATNADGTHKIDLTNIPISPDNFVTARLIVASLAIDPTLYTGDLKQYRLLFIPGAVINDNVTTTLTVNFYDADLLTDATNLFNLYSSIPAGGGLGSYHGRMINWNYNAVPFVKGSNTVCLVSNPGQPEAFDQVTGLIQIPLSDFGITRAQEYRDILYVFRENQTFAFGDNGGNPSSWTSVVIDNGLGCAKHGMAISDENQTINLEFLPMFNINGVFLFNGIFSRPELTWKINDFWTGKPGVPSSGLDLPSINLLSEMYNDTLNEKIYINIPQLGMILMGDYRNGLTFKDIRWMKWNFNVEPTTMSLLFEQNTLIIGSRKGFP